MSETVRVLLEVVKYTVPALIVFITVYFLQRRFYQGQIRLKQLEMSRDNTPQVFRMRVQAYERLSLMCERISLTNLVYRLYNTKLSVREFQNVLLVTVQQEFDHNLSQQIYVSEKLWRIIQLSKDEVLQVISDAASEVPDEASAGDLRIRLLQKHGEGASPAERALIAIRKEVQVLF
jgi:hypothetical protein